MINKINLLVEKNQRDIESAFRISKKHNLWKNCPFLMVIFFLLESIMTTFAQQKIDSLSLARERADKIKNPSAWFNWGADIRFRHEFILNPSLIDTDPPGYFYNYERMRVREWNTFSPCKWLELNLRFAWEGRHYWKPDSKAEWDKSELVFDNLNFKFKFKKIPLTLTVGRQDIIFGNGWLVSDGTPLDGPRTTYFEAIRATVDMKKINSLLDLIYIDQTSDPSRRLPPVFSQDNPITEQDERGIIVNFSNKSINHIQIDPYFIFKHDEAVLTNGDQGNVYVIGTRLNHNINTNLTSYVEGAYQFGTRTNTVMYPNQDSSLSAFGINSRLTFSLPDSLKNQFWLGYAVLSGNNVHDKHNHQFDPLWGRWAQYSELFPNELDRPGERSNLHRINLGYQVEPLKVMLIQTNYHAIIAYGNRNSGTTGFSNNGRFKGQLFTVLTKYQLNRFWSCLLLGEYFVPGNYYETPPGDVPLHTRNKPAVFLRVQIVFTF